MTIINVHPTTTNISTASILSGLIVYIMKTHDGLISDEAEPWGLSKVADIPSLKFPTSPTFLKGPLEISRSAIYHSTNHDQVIHTSCLFEINAKLSFISPETMNPVTYPLCPSFNSSNLTLALLNSNSLSKTLATIIE